MVGSAVGVFEGWAVGVAVVGTALGMAVGAKVGTAVASHATWPSTSCLFTKPGRQTQTKLIPPTGSHLVVFLSQKSVRASQRL